LADGGAALLESVREGRGPRGFHLVRRDDDDDDDDGWVQFNSPEWFISFLNAMGGNSYVERLDLSNIGSR
jgi:hypothetical protein